MTSLVAVWNHAPRDSNGRFMPRVFDIKGWMQQVAENRECSSYKMRDGRVVEVVFRY